MSEPGRRVDLSQINPPVFFGSVILIFAIVIFGASTPDIAGKVFSSTQSWIVDSFGWLYLLAVAIFLFFSLYLALSRYGSIRLGPEHSLPDFSYGSWFAMLFSAGMGIGLLFYGVAEPVLHMSSPPQGEGQTIEAAREAMATTFFHWGLHAWSIYAVVGLSLAYFGFRHRLPLTLRSALFPIIGERMNGPLGHAVDIFAVLGTMFGVATSLGLGVMQVNTGLNYLFGLTISTPVQIGLIVAITGFATVSVVAGLDAGIRRLSILNVMLAAVLMVYMAASGPTQHLFQALVQNTGHYLDTLVNKTFNLYAYEPTDWMGAWTLFYWGWWIAWSPFVGMFIARVSRGRTIREFVMGVLFVPVGFTFVWMTLFGNTAIALDFGIADGAISAAVNSDVTTAVFKVFEYLPLGTVASLLATLLVITFFVTSSDSGSLVIDIITSGGNHEPPVWQRVFWAVTEGVVAAVLLLAGGLSALQSATIASALPFTFIMLIICYGLFKGLRLEALKLDARNQSDLSVTNGEVPWQVRLKRMVTFPGKEKAKAFLNSEVLDAFSAVSKELAKHDRECRVQREADSIQLKVYHGDEETFRYGVFLSSHIAPGFVVSDLHMDESKQRHFYRLDVHLTEGAQHYDIMDYTREQIISDILSQYNSHLLYLDMARADNTTIDPKSQETLT
ncbi:BCCT family transporter [Spongiibacter sp. UBA1325]|uniref:BCCT family transporter n=1 Tax=Spongiibacter sp. UBA1325 TaxID=1947543 RepID=UPI00257CF37C|nr:choline BCCT transporter BetT [Spongiibacter sp. UBA1325]|tara:strand:+ start:1617 stop:3632 length:2016 start_codon:yes stop_codon:yes gene_type:complete